MNGTNPASDRTDQLRKLLVETVESTAGRRPGTRRLALASVAVLGTVAVVSLLAIGAIPGDLGSSNGNGTTGETSSGSRVKLYGSLAELVADSAVVVTGSVVSQESVGDSTVATLRVEEAFAPAGLGSGLGERRPAPERDSEIQVRQTGTIGTVSSAGQVLTTGQHYLLFLVPTGLPDAAEDEYFITGAGAGAYSAVDDGFRRLTDDGDSLPVHLTEADLAG